MKLQTCLASLVTLCLVPLAQSQEFVAYQITAGQAGNQSAGASLGLDFNVTGPITVNRLGCFDDEADGIVNTITVELWTRDDGGTPEDRADDVAGVMLESLTFSAAAPGILDGGHRFKDLAVARDLPIGAYTIVSYGYGADDRNYNTNFAPGVAPLTEEGGGAIEFVGRRFGGGGTYPGTVDGGINARYRAGTFAFELLDSDDDGMPDFWEDQFSLDKNDATDASDDPDGDNLDNVTEYNGGTNPQEKDSDFDGADDDVELSNGTDPGLPDSDFDGLMDGPEDNAGSFTDEDSIGTDPLVVDTDADGYDDGAEVELLSDPTDSQDTPINTFGEPAYAVAKTVVGNQSVPGSIGLDFDVDGRISIGYLGAFDNGSDGFTNPITVEIWGRDANGTPADPTDDVGVGFAPLVSVVINPGEGFLQGSNRFKVLPTPFVIDTDSDPSSYSIVAFGFSGDDQNFNLFGADAVAAGLTLSDNLAVSYSGLGRYAAGGATNVFPGIVDGGPVNRYAGGTFAFTTEDADQDGMPDFWEDLYGLNKNFAGDASLDGDLDNLSNLEEFQRDLNPTDADTDGDNSEDGAEVVAGTDPKNPDTDGDTLTDGAETAGGTNPLLTDSDGDDFTDNRELDEGSDPTDVGSVPTVNPSGVLAYQADVGSLGNQTNFTGSAGLDFVVNSPLVISELGAFDSGGDGFIGEITVRLWSRDDNGTTEDFTDDIGDSVLAEIVFDPANRGDLRNGHRTQALSSAVVLQPGSYSIVASGFGVEDPMGNGGQATPPVLTTVVDASLSFVGGGRFQGLPGVFPGNVDAGPANRYGAGTFAFELPAGEPVVTDFTWNPGSETGSITFLTVPDAEYEIQYSSDLGNSGFWLGLDDLSATSNETTFLIDLAGQAADAQGSERLYFRAVKLE